MITKRRSNAGATSDWRPKELGIGIHDLALATVPELTKAAFGARLKEYLQERGFSQFPDRGLTDKLYRHTCHCRQQIEAVRKMHEIIESRDWHRREAVFGFLWKKINSFERGLGKYRDVKLPLTDMLVRSVTARIVTFNNSIKHDLRLYAKMTANERQLVSGYLKPEVESQYMLDTYNILAKHLRSLKVEELLLIVAGCVYAGKILPHARDEEDLHNRIDSRIRRARAALKRESGKYEWALADDFSPFFLLDQKRLRISERIRR
jgi:hypothetical protein